MLDKKDLHRIVETQKFSRINKIWKNPKKAQAYGEGAFMLAFVFGAILLVTALTIETFDNYDKEELQKQKQLLIDFKLSTFKNMNCEGLKQTLLDIKTFEFYTDKLETDLRDNILARCN